MNTMVMPLFLLSLCFAMRVYAVDYSKYTHKVFIDTLRAGNHDASGTDEYYFTLTLKALRNTKEDVGLDAEKRQVLARDAVKFGEVAVKVLTNWVPESGKPEEILFTNTDGDAIRELVSEAMRTFGVREDEVAVVGDVQMFEKNKKYMFFGEDTLVGKAKYFPVPSTKFQAPARTNLKLSIIDDKGTDVVIKVKYDFPNEEQKNEPEAKKDVPTATASPKP